jgi:hypothetical protein
MPQVIEVPNYGQVEFPDDMTDDQIVAAIKKTSMGYKAEKKTGFFGDMSLKNVPKNLGNLGAGLVRGAGSIGATALLPADMINQKLRGEDFLSLKDNKERRALMDAGLQTLGADTNSGLYETGKLGGEIAGTAGAGDVLALGAAGMKMPLVANALKSGGFNLGGTTGSRALNAALRVGGGAVNGGSQAALANPESAGTGAIIGGMIPVAGKIAGETGNLISSGANKTAKSLMQSALKPTLKQLRTGEADRAIQTLLDEGISPTSKGVNQLKAKIWNINDEVANRISNSTATIDKQNVLNTLTDVRSNFANQVSPTSDLNAIQGVADDFSNHPGLLGGSFPVQTAQQLKQGTYKVLKGKYGEAGSAATEAQKGLARGLKDEISKAVPEVAGLNAKESELINALSVAERRALMDANKNTMGLAVLASNPVGWAAFMADRSAAFKAIAARMANQAGKAAGSNTNNIGLLLANPATRGLLVNAND